jgi:hypothetical protein
MFRLLSLPALVFALASALPAAEALPLDMGNYWIYRDERSGESFEIRVGQPLWLQNGRIYHQLRGYSSERVFARIDERGNLVVLNDETGTESLLTGFAENAETWWHAPNRECSQEGQTQERRVSYEGPGGRWRQAIDIRYRSANCADAGATAEIFAPNIGMLRRTVTTIAGPKTFDLVYAHIGNQIIETRDRARFSVSVDQPVGKDELQVTLRVDLGFTPFIKLFFPTSQTFDVALRNSSGGIVWSWSDGKVFATAMREQLIGNVWTETVIIPKPAGDLTDFTIEGWLTTAPGEPKFAATTPMPPPRVER